MQVNALIQMSLSDLARVNDDNRHFTMHTKQQPEQQPQLPSEYLSLWMAAFHEHKLISIVQTPYLSPGCFYACVIHLQRPKYTAIVHE